MDTQATKSRRGMGPSRVLAALTLICIASLLVASTAASRPLARSMAGVPARHALADAATVGVGQVPTYAVALAGRVYVSDCADNSVSVIDEATQAAVATIPVGRCPSAIAADPATNLVYVANSTDQTVSAIDTTTDQVVGAPIQVFVHVEGGLAVDPAANRIYVGDPDGNTVTTIDGGTGYVFPGSPGVIAVGNDVEGLAVDPGTGHVYVSNFGDGTVTDLDANGSPVGAPIAIGPETDLLALDPGVHRLYVVDTSGNSVSVVDTTSDTVVGTPIPVGNNPQGIAVDTNLHRVYVADQADNMISVIDGTTDTVLGAVATGVGPSGMAFDQSTEQIYVTYPDSAQAGALVDPGPPGYGTPTVTATETPSDTPAASTTPTTSATPAASDTATSVPSGTSTPAASITPTTSATPCGDGGSFGLTNPGQETDVYNENLLTAGQFTTGATAGTVSSVSVDIVNPDSAPHNQYQVAIYRDAGGSPGTLLAASALGTVTAAGWNTMALSASLAPNTPYWLAYNSNASDGSHDNLTYNDTGGHWAVADNVPFGSMPTTLTVTNTGIFQFAIYATFQAAGCPTATPTAAPPPRRRPAPAMVSRTIAYTYDGIGELTGAGESPGSSFAYSYDPAGNRASAGVDDTTISYTQDLAGSPGQILAATTGGTTSEELRDAGGTLRRATPG